MDDGLARQRAARSGATVLTQDTCLRHARVDPTPWTRQVEAWQPATPACGYQPMRQCDLKMFWALLDRARAAIATEHGIPQCAAEDRIRLITWMLFTDPTNKATS